MRQLVAEKRFDILLLQESYLRKQGENRTFYGLRTGMKVAAVRSETLIGVYSSQQPPIANNICLTA